MAPNPIKEEMSLREALSLMLSIGQTKSNHELCREEYKKRLALKLKIGHSLTDEPDMYAVMLYGSTDVVFTNGEKSMSALELLEMSWEHKWQKYQLKEVFKDQVQYSSTTHGAFSMLVWSEMVRRFTGKSFTSVDELDVYLGMARKIKDEPL